VPRTEETSAAGEAHHRLRVLIVDDEKDLAEALGILLEESGHEIRIARDGLAALEAARTYDPDVVLLDLGLPRMDGYELARRLRTEHRDRKRLIVAISGYQDDGIRAKEAGIDHHLTKPPPIGRLLQLLERWEPSLPKN
jgi:CheY-like chemotaxis protein